MKRKHGLCLAFALLEAAAPWARAAGDESLHFFEEEAEVITASRRKEAARESPVRVEVITAEDIRASGALNLWDLFRYRSGLDVLDMNTVGFSGRGMVSIRGFLRPRNLVRQILVLVDGRSVITPLRASADWEQLVVQLQDIERIEIVRGPSAALFDSNAALGTINIITKKTGGKTAASASVAAGNQGIRRGEAALESSAGGFRYRLSHTRRTQDGTVVASGARANDFLFSNKGNFRGAWESRGGTSLDLAAGASWDSLGDNTVTGTPSKDRFHNYFQMLRLEKPLGEGGALELMTARRDYADDGDSTDVRNLQYDLDVLYRLDWDDGGMNTTLGASYRYMSAESAQYFPGGPEERNEVYRGFLHQTLRLFDPLSAVAAVALESSDTGQLDPSYQAAFLYRLVEDHRLRLTHGIAQTLPTLLDKYGTVQQGPTRRTVGNPALDEDRLQSYELGYQGFFLERRLEWEANAFYTRVRDLSTNIQTSKVGILTTFQFQNVNSAIARGLELEWTYRWRKSDKLYLNYTLEKIRDSLGDIAVREATPRHKLNAGAHVRLARGFSAGFDLGYKDKYRFDNTVAEAVPAYWRLDARLAYRMGGLEFFLAGQNLTRPLHHLEFQRSLDVPRTYYGGVSWRFGAEQEAE